MRLAIVNSRASSGIEAPPVTVEIHISGGLPSMNIVGLPETAVKESRDRVRSAIMNSQFRFPASRITISLAPADLPKDGGRFDLPIALGILAATKQIPTAALKDYEFCGELALSGELRPIYGALPFALATRAAQRTLILPFANANEASLLSNVTLYAARHLLEVCAHLKGTQRLPPYLSQPIETSPIKELNLNEVQGQHLAKRSLEIAAAGQHSLLMIGPPGTGKTMLANRLPGILPEMTEAEALEVCAVLSVAGKPIDFKHWRRRCVRTPHHTASPAALVGGGRPPRPGEISLAHNGILFLDELPEFNRQVIEAMREPLESGKITISRASFQAQFPATFQLIAAMNPCPCGHLGDDQRCQCSSEQIRRYQSRISGPILDRLDMQIQMPKITRALLHPEKESGESSSVIRARVNKARAIQITRAQKPNARLSSHEVTRDCHIDPAGERLLERAIERFSLSGRGLHRCLRVARTIADLAECSDIKAEHLQEAIHYRFAGDQDSLR